MSETMDHAANGAVDDSVAPTAVAAGVSKPVLIASCVQLVAATLLIVLLFLEWVRGGYIGLEGNGGGGFGVLTLITALVTYVAAVQGLRGQRTERRIFGPNQLAATLALALFFSNLVFLWVFRTGGAPKWVYVAGNLLIYSSVVGLFASKPDRTEPLSDSTIRRLGAATAVLGILIAAAPALEYTKLGSRTLTGFEPGAPRIGVLLLFVGGIVTFVGLQRVFRGASYTDVGPHVLWSQIMIALGIIAAAPAFAWLISGVWGDDFDPGVGVYISLLLGIGLAGLGIFESSKRSASGV